MSILKDKLIPHTNQITCIQCEKRMLKRKDHFVCVECGASRTNDLLKIETMFLYLFAEGVKRQNVDSIRVEHHGKSKIIPSTALRDPVVFGYVFANAIAIQAATFNTEKDKDKIQPDLYLEHGSSVHAIRLKEDHNILDAFVLGNRLVNRIQEGFGGKNYSVVANER